jgi:hypothetical protein
MQPAQQYNLEVDAMGGFVMATIFFSLSLSPNLFLIQISGPG